MAQPAWLGSHVFNGLVVDTITTYLEDHVKQDTTAQTRKPKQAPPCIFRCPGQMSRGRSVVQHHIDRHRSDGLVQSPTDGRRPYIIISSLHMGCKDGVGAWDFDESLMNVIPGPHHWRESPGSRKQTQIRQTRSKRHHLHRVIM